MPKKENFHLTLINNKFCGATEEMLESQIPESQQ
jgi:hypothetical protein